MRVLGARLRQPRAVRYHFDCDISPHRSAALGRNANCCRRDRLPRPVQSRDVQHGAFGAALNGTFVPWCGRVVGGAVSSNHRTRMVVRYAIGGDISGFHDRTDALRIGLRSDQYHPRATLTCRFCPSNAQRAMSALNLNRHRRRAGNQAVHRQFC